MKLAAVILQKSPLKRAAAVKWNRGFPISIKAFCKKSLLNTVQYEQCKLVIVHSQKDFLDNRYNKQDNF